MAESVPSRKPRKKQHHGTTAQQIEALDWLATATAADLEQVKAALVTMGILPEPEAAAPSALPRDLVDPAGFPSARHPEALEGELPEPDEEWLASVAADLWPADEYEPGAGS
jgi:hypothetical protein